LKISVNGTASTLISVVSFPNPLKSGAMESRTVFQLLQQDIDLFGRPGKAFYAALGKFAKPKRTP